MSLNLAIPFFLVSICKILLLTAVRNWSPCYELSWQNQQNGICTKWRLRTAWASICIQWVAKDPSFLHADSEDWSDRADAQADLSLRWAHMPFCWFWHEVAHFCITFFHSFESSARQAHAATNQQLPRVPCEKSSELTPEVKNFGSDAISCN